jgi:hypothetical protein
MTDSPVGQVKLLRGAAEVLVARGSIEDAQCGERGEAASHVNHSNRCGEKLSIRQKASAGHMRAGH